MTVDPVMPQAHPSSGCSNRMPYGLIAIAALIGLSAAYVFVTDASWWSKLLIAALVFLSVFGFPPLPILRLLLQVGVSLFLIFYFKVRYEIF